MCAEFDRVYAALRRSQHVREVVQRLSADGATALPAAISTREQHEELESWPEVDRMRVAAILGPVPRTQECVHHPLSPGSSTTPGRLACRHWAARRRSSPAHDGDRGDRR